MLAYALFDKIVKSFLFHVVSYSSNELIQADNWSSTSSQLYSFERNCFYKLIQSKMLSRRKNMAFNTFVYTVSICKFLSFGSVHGISVS